MINKNAFAHTNTIIYIHREAPTIPITEVSIYSDIKPTGICADSKNCPTLVKTSMYRRM